jgi:hypothetical protein
MELYIEYRAKKVGLGFDDLIEDALATFGANRLSSGCCLFGDYVRDIQFDVQGFYFEDAILAIEELAKQHPDVCLTVSEG